MITAMAKRSVGRPQTIDPDKIWPEVLGYIASGDALSTALKRLDPAPSYTWAKVQLYGHQPRGHPWAFRWRVYVYRCHVGLS